MEKKLLLIGGGGHCHSVIDSVLSIGEYSEIGIIDSVECSYQGVSRIGTDDDLPRLFIEGWTDAFIAVGSVGNTDIRRRLYDYINKIGYNIPDIIDSSALISRGVSIGKGVFIGKRAVVNIGVVIGACSIVNTGSIIEHDCSIGDFSHISPSAVLCGNVSVGNDTHIGAGSVVKQGVTIGDHTMIGAGSVVVSNFADNIKAYGNPCKAVN